MDTKNKTLRAALKQKRSQLSLPEQTQAASKALKHWQSCPELCKAQTYAAFWATNGEMPTQPLLDHLLANGQDVLLPRVCPQQPEHMIFGHYDATTPMITDQYGIKSPDIEPHNAIALEKAQIIIVPLVAVDQRGNRLGMGKGYYDRALENMRSKPEFILMGWCYSWQMITEPLTPAPWDVPIHGAVTEKGVTWFSSTTNTPVTAR